MSRFPRRMLQAGFGLIELMIAMLLGLLVLGAAIAVFQSNQRTFNANEGQNRVQEGARVAYEMMSRDIRAAGGTPCSRLARPDVEHALNAQETALLTAAVSGNGSEFTVVSAEDSSYRITGATTNTITLAAPASQPGWKLSHAFADGNRMVICNGTQLYVVSVAGGGVNDATRTLTYTPATPVPIYNPGVPPAPPAATVSVSRYRSNRWYLDGGALKVARNGAAGEEVTGGVTAMNVAYLRSGANTYVAAPSQWDDVVAVRVNLTLRGQKTLGGDVKVDGNNYITRTTSNMVNIRSRP